MTFALQLPCGTYYVGDICYSLTDETYDNVWGGAHKYENGLFHVGALKLPFAVHATAYGDGVYPGSDGFDYPVDAGVIGMVDHRLAKSTTKGIKGTKRYTFKHPVTFSYTDGIFTIVDGHGFHLTIGLAC